MFNFPLATPIPKHVKTITYHFPEGALSYDDYKALESLSIVDQRKSLHVLSVETLVINWEDENPFGSENDDPL